MPATPTLTALLDDPRIWRAGRLAQESAAVPAGHPALADLLPGGGWPVGTLSELCIERAGIGELYAILPALATLSRAGKAIGFVGAPFVPYAPALAAAGLDLARLLCVEAPDGARRVWAAEQMLGPRACGAVVIWTERLPMRHLRRLQLAAGDAGTLAFLIRPAQVEATPSPAALRLKLEPVADGLAIHVRKSRGAGRGSAILRFDSYDVRNSRVHSAADTLDTPDTPAQVCEPSLQPTPAAPSPLSVPRHALSLDFDAPLPERRESLEPDEPAT